MKCSIPRRRKTFWEILHFKIGRRQFSKRAWIITSWRSARSPFIFGALDLSQNKYFSCTKLCHLNVSIISWECTVLYCIWIFLTWRSQFLLEGLNYLELVLGSMALQFWHVIAMLESFIFVAYLLQLCQLNVSIILRASSQWLPWGCIYVVDSAPEHQLNQRLTLPTEYCTIEYSP